MSNPRCAALLVAGYDAAGPNNATVLGDIGETLLATQESWHVRRLTADTGDRYSPDRTTIKRFIDELVQRPLEVAVIAVCGMIFHGALVTGAAYRDYEEDATLSLAWLRDRIQGARAARVLLVLSAHGEGDAADWLRELGTAHADHVIAVEAGVNGTMLTALLAGLRGAALDPRTGSVTLRSLSEHLARTVPGISLQQSLASATLASTPPLQSRLARPSTVPWSGSDPAPQGLIGLVLPGRFRVDREMARGSFGTVYRARQLSIERDVAVKVVDGEVDPSSEEGRLFVHEIQSVGRIDHENVVRIYQADVTPHGRLFFAMELLVGSDLQQVVNVEGTLGRERALGLTRQLLAGLAAVHHAGLVHADVKPANVFLAAGRGGERVVLLDFGLSRLKPATGAATSAGGTPAYMAPEQLQNGRVDARSDLFSAALVLVTLLTGWRRQSAREHAPPSGSFDDAALAATLARALSIDPDGRFQTAGELSAALAGETLALAAPRASRPPFRHLAPMTEGDHASFHGREHDLGRLIEQVLYRRAVIYTGPSGMGKTSLLRAGLVPRIETLGGRAVYMVCRSGMAQSLAAAIWPGETGVAEAVGAWHEQRGRKLVLILDQVESVLGEPIVDEALAFGQWPPAADVTVVLGIREDALARLIGTGRRIEEGLSIIRLGPLDDAGARAAILGPLAEHRLTMAPELLEVLLADLRAAAAALGEEHGWGAEAAAYPPHLQLVCSALYGALPHGEALITLEAYRRLGALDAIVGEQLDRVIENELDAASATVARDVFAALVTAAHGRAFRPEGELLEALGGRHGAERVTAVLELLRARGLLVRVRASDGGAGWELIHDSLVPRVLSWLDRGDLARRRALELLRYHLRRSRPEAPSLLGRAELRELRGHEGALAELDQEWSRRDDAGGWKPTTLVARSRRLVRRQRGLLAAAIVVALAAGGLVAVRELGMRAERAREQSFRDRDLGRFVLEFRPFDWDAEHLKILPVAASELPDLDWKLYAPAEDDPENPGEELPPHFLTRVSGGPAGEARVDHVEARGGSAFLVVSGRHRQRNAPCASSIVHLAQLPGYGTREATPPTLLIRVPTCDATEAGMVVIPAGPFIFGGVGEPPEHVDTDLWLEPEGRELHLPAYLMDRTEVTNAAYSAFAQMTPATHTAMPDYPASSDGKGTDNPDSPAAGVNWFQARAYCRFLGKDLPTTEEWTKAMRGGLDLPDGKTNPMPRRNLPWGTIETPTPANIADMGPIVAAVGSFPKDSSPYGVKDMAGNVEEWTRSTPQKGFKTTRGGNWANSRSSDLVDYVATDNRHVVSYTTFYLGMRCVLDSQN